MSATHRRPEFRHGSRHTALHRPALCAEIIGEPLPDFRHVETHTAFAQLQMRAALRNEVVHAAHRHLNHARHVAFAAVALHCRQRSLIAGGGFQRLNVFRNHMATMPRPARINQDSKKTGIVRNSAVSGCFAASPRLARQVGNDGFITCTPDSALPFGFLLACRALALPFQNGAQLGNGVARL